MTIIIPQRKGNCRFTERQPAGSGRPAGSRHRVRLGKGAAFHLRPSNDAASAVFFDRHGRPLNKGFGRELNKDDYIEQLIYVNQLVTNVMANILSKPKKPPIIVLQGDHGFRSLQGTNRTNEATTILNAYHLPGAQPGWVYEGITPVNSFRMIFNHYFGTQYFYHPDVQLTDKDQPPGRQLKD